MSPLCLKDTVLEEAVGRESQRKNTALAWRIPRVYILKLSSDPTEYYKLGKNTYKTN